MTWSCEQIEERLTDYLDGALAAAEKAEYAAHISKLLTLRGVGRKRRRDGGVSASARTIARAPASGGENPRPYAGTAQGAGRLARMAGLDAFLRAATLCLRRAHGIHHHDRDLTGTWDSLESSDDGRPQSDKRSALGGPRRRTSFMRAGPSSSPICASFTKSSPGCSPLRNLRPRRPQTRTPRDTVRFFHAARIA